MGDPDVLGSVARHWDRRASSFDEEPDHGLRDPATRAAWRERLADWVGPAPCDVVDLGCGTGSLTVLLAGEGHRVLGGDLSSEMVSRAAVKARRARVDATFRVMDAGDPDLPSGSADVVLVRHVLWTLPDPGTALRRWFEALRPGGRLVLVEGRWDSPGDPTDEYAPIVDRLPLLDGTPADTAAALVAQVAPDATVTVEALDDPVLWGRPVDDERYVLLADTPSRP